MKKYLPYFLVLLVAAFVCFGAFKSLSHKKHKASKRHKKSQFFPVVEAKPFVIVIPSYNNEAICTRNLQSVFDQKYENYRVIYIDDQSKDKTYENVKNFIAASHQENRVTLIRNEKNLGALENLYRAIVSCADHEIIVILDGDDWFAHDWVLKKLNECYANPNIWLTYGSYLSYPPYTKGECSRLIPEEVFKKKTLREFCSEHGTIASHLRTFYTGLFKKIKFQDLLYNGNFFDSTYDGAIMLPMLEMARDNLFFVPDILYIYNRSNPLNDDKVNFEKQQRCWRTILSMSPYDKLDYLTFSSRGESSQADVVVFSYDRPLQLYAYLESLQHYVKNVGKVSVIYRTSREEFALGYEELKEAFPQVVFYRQSDRPYEDFKPLVLQTAFSGPSEYLLFAVDDIIVKDFFDIKEAIQAMKETSAKGFYYRLGKHVDYCYMLDQDQGIPFTISLNGSSFPLLPKRLNQNSGAICAWQFKNAKGDWNYPCSLDMTLYKKEDIRDELRALAFTTPNTLEAEWAKKAKMDQVGLCYETSKIVNIPLSLVNPSTNRHMNAYSPDELLKLFNQGLKIDHSDLFQIHNKSAHIEHNPNFVQR